MREIKFRAWDGLNKVMKIYTLKELADQDKFSCDTEYEAIQSGFDNWAGKYKYIIEWYRSGWIKKPIGWWRFTSLYQYIEREEIIGNIHQNPELLKH